MDDENFKPDYLKGRPSLGRTSSSCKCRGRPGWGSGRSSAREEGASLEQSPSTVGPAHHGTSAPASCLSFPTHLSTRKKNFYKW